ncbi:MAG: DUF4255 domain-containing protein [Anaerolineae bacterium]|nr:DUF4255 domain-containing protein [Anaerolineae bacterium]MCB9131739.1 DUF4255 domain-containing protein [Anaerolineales bacterium]MCB0230910.1 DUF4255 domain-containing protein [Anaerolineae bacterium]MCB0235315.1 DUF4255 domain-containing protein [Anaerolineae bacterium]MCB0238239.1 DUF4255 domain-containing protein [Anaerolineae bacterium]
MADYRALAAVSEAVLALLRSNYQPEDFNNELDFRVFLARDFGSSSLQSGVSLFLYRVMPNGTYRSPTGRLTDDGRRYRNQLAVDMHFILSAWGREASLQHTIAGWMMRVMEDSPVLPAGLLNSVIPDAFQPDESVELTLADLSNEDLLHVWETLVQNVYQLSVPYVARNIRIESRLLLTTGQPVQQRTFDYTSASGI